jgi:hypothetical protein
MTEKYELNKINIKKWRETNKEHNRYVNKICKRRYDNWKRIQKVFMSILLE